MLMLDGQPFTQGSQPIFYGPIGTGENDQRVVLEVVIKEHRIQAMLDTGAAFVVCAPNIADRIGLDPDAAVDRTHLLIRGKWVSGALYRLDVTLPAEQGTELTINATTFVPDPGIPWPELPSIVGLEGFLDSVRFALDTTDETFYFGAHPHSVIPTVTSRDTD